MTDLPRAWRAPLVALALLSMVWGAWLGLLRLGWVLPLPRPDQLILHGPLMIGGFVGTLIGLERAVGLGGALRMTKCVALGWLVATVLVADFARAQTAAGNPASPDGLTVSGSPRGRVESWNWFKADGGTDYAYLRSIPRLAEPIGRLARRTRVPNVRRAARRCDRSGGARTPRLVPDVRPPFLKTGGGQRCSLESHEPG